MMDEDKRLKEAFMSLLDQASGTYDRIEGEMIYDHEYLSAYENALDLALEFGWIKKKQVSR